MKLLVFIVMAVIALVFVGCGHTQAPPPVADFAKRSRIQAIEARNVGPVDTWPKEEQSLYIDLKYR